MILFAETKLYRRVFLCGNQSIIIYNPLICRRKQGVRLNENCAKAFASKLDHYQIFTRKEKHQILKQER